MRAGLVLAALGAAAACGGSDPAADAPPGSGDARGDAPPGTADARVDALPGTPDAAMTTCTTALLYNDCAGTANCASVPEPLRSDDAAQALGIATLYGGNNDQAAFRTLYDAGGFDVIVFESSSHNVEVATAGRLAAWVQAGGKIVLSFWDLDGLDDVAGGSSGNAAVAATLRTALEVATPASLSDNPRSVYDDAAGGVSFFTRVEAFPSPLTFSNIGIDDGDEVTPSGAGFVAARFTSATGPGAIAVTHGGAAVVLGFLPIELLYQVVRDADSDGRPDVVELYTNALGYLCGQ